MVSQSPHVNQSLTTAIHKALRRIVITWVPRNALPVNPTGDRVIKEIFVAISRRSAPTVSVCILILSSVKSDPATVIHIRKHAMETELVSLFRRLLWYQLRHQHRHRLLLHQLAHKLEKIVQL
jgi:hypothetical protein